jgi:hypothetical protein
MTTGSVRGWCWAAGGLAPPDELGGGERLRVRPRAIDREQRAPVVVEAEQERLGAASRHEGQRQQRGGVVAQVDAAVGPDERAAGRVGRARGEPARVAAVAARPVEQGAREGVRRAQTGGMALCLAGQSRRRPA